MTVNLIDAVRVVDLDAIWYPGGKHQHVVAVHLADARVHEREDVVQNIRSASQGYATKADARALVRVGACPLCGEEGHLTAARDGRTVDRLLELPRF